MSTWHTLDSEEIFDKAQSSKLGLDQEQVLLRLRRDGPNEIKEKKRRSPLMLLLDQFTDFMIIVLIAASVISGFIGEISDTIAILVIIVLNAVIGFVQEFRAERAITALKKMASPTSIVKRNGKLVEVLSNEIVCGDLVYLEAGRIIPADLRLIEVSQLKTGEAAITGEAHAVSKRIEKLENPDLPLGDRINMAFKGTVVTLGRGVGVVIATGMNTELGKIATLLQGESEVKTPLQQRLAAFGARLALAVLVICGIVFAVGLLRGEPPLRMLLTAISLAVAAIPEALPAVVTISLAFGAGKLVKQNALIRKLPAVETLGSVTYICSDKTGTLTLNKMTVEQVLVDNVSIGVQKLTFKDQNEKGPLQSLLLAMAISTDVMIKDNNAALGDPTEIALYNCALVNGYDKSFLEKTYKRVMDLPFDSERKMMTTFHRCPDGAVIAFTKGALDSVLPRSKSLVTSGGEDKIDTGKINRENDLMTSKGMRVLAFAVRTWYELPREPLSEIIEKDLVFIGLVGMIDPPRDEAVTAVHMCKTAGIHPVMITGDHPGTAAAIAKRVGIIESENDRIVTGAELEAMGQGELENQVEQIKVYARVAPHQKLKVLKALQDKGQFAAMTGDGVNDAPALKRANIGIAMGITGTDVSKEAAHMILLDDNFATIVNTIREGRRIFDNIRKFIRYTMTSNSGEIWTIFLAPLLGLPIPLLPIHILWINLVTDGLPGLALAAEPADSGIMMRPPRHPKESIFSGGMGGQIIWVGLLMGLVSLATQVLSMHHFSNWRTMVFTVLTFSQMGNVLAIRSESESVFKIGLLSNKPLFGAFMLTVVLQLATVYIPFLNPVFKTAPLSPVELLIALLFSSVVFFAIEIDKMIKRIRLVKS